MKLPAIHPVPPISEAAFQAQVLHLASMYGWELAYHTHDSRKSTAGFPDLELVRPPRIVKAELKKLGGQPTPEQCEWLEAYSKCPGVEAYLWRPDDWDEITAVLKG